VVVNDQLTVDTCSLKEPAEDPGQGPLGGAHQLHPHNEAGSINTLQNKKGGSRNNRLNVVFIKCYQFIG
jgi:hypothetical protein